MDTATSWLKLLSLVFIDVIALGGNFLMLVIGLRNNLLRTNQNAFIFNMALSDFLQAVFIMPSAIFSISSKYWVLGKSWCNLFAILKVMFTLSSVYSLSGISIIRYFHVVHRARYMSSWRGAIICIVFSWFMSILLSVTPLLGWGQMGFEDGKEVCTVLFQLNLSHTLTIFTTGLFLNIIVMIGCYICIFKKLRRSNLTVQRRSIIRDRTCTMTIWTDEISIYQRSQDKSTGQKSAKNLNINGSNDLHTALSHINNQRNQKPELIEYAEKLKRDKASSQPKKQSRDRTRSLRKPRRIISMEERTLDDLNIRTKQKVNRRLKIIRRFSPKEFSLLKTVFIIIIVFTFCWMPYVIFNLMRLFGLVGNINSVDTVTMWLGFLNSAANPVMYGVLNKQFRKAMKTVFWSNRQRRSSEPKTS